MKCVVVCRQSHDVLWRSEIWKEDDISSNGGRSPQPAQVNTQIHTMQHKTGVSSLQIHIVLFSFIFHCLKKKKKIVSFMSRHSCTNLTVKLPLWRFSPFRPLASVLTGNLREHHGYKVMWSFLLFLLHSYEKRLFWEEAKEAEKKKKENSCWNLQTENPSNRQIYANALLLTVPLHSYVIQHTHN